MNKCSHHSLYFGSGDYYIFCEDCNRHWVTKDTVAKLSTLSGKSRSAPGLLKGTSRVSDTYLVICWMEIMGLKESIEFRRTRST